MREPNILCLNGSLRGPLGNSARVLQFARQHAQGRARLVEVCLAEAQLPPPDLEAQLRAADAFLLCSGVYWNSHGSCLQRFLEVATCWEATDVFLGKPAGVVLSMDSVGGMEVAARLMSTLNLFGCMAPPLGTVVLSRVAQIASQQGAQQDVYSLADVGLLLDNLIATAAHPRPAWRSWPVKPTGASENGYAAPGLLNVDHAPWLAPQGPA